MIQLIMGNEVSVNEVNIRIPAALLCAISSKVRKRCAESNRGMFLYRETIAAGPQPPGASTIVNLTLSDGLVSWFYTGRLTTHPLQYQLCWCIGKQLGAPSLQNDAFEQLCEILMICPTNEVKLLLEKPLKEVM